MDFPWLKSMMLVCGTPEERSEVIDHIERIRSTVPWQKVDSLRQASMLISARDEDTPALSTIAERQDHWSGDIAVIVMDEPLGYDVDATTLLGVSHVADKGIETGVCGVAGLIWEGEDPWTKQSHGDSDLLSIVLGESILLKCDQVDKVMDDLFGAEGRFDLDGLTRP